MWQLNVKVLSRLDYKAIDVATGATVVLLGCVLYMIRQLWYLKSVVRDYREILPYLTYYTPYLNKKKQVFEKKVEPYIVFFHMLFAFKRYMVLLCVYRRF